MPRLGIGDLRAYRFAARGAISVPVDYGLHDVRVMLLFGCKVRGVRLVRVLVAVCVFGSSDRRQHERRAEGMHQRAHQMRFRATPRQPRLDTVRVQFVEPHLGVRALRIGELLKHVAARRIFLDMRKRLIQRRAVQFVGEVGPVAFEFVFGGHE
jgi:hypothetical protein